MFLSRWLRCCAASVDGLVEASRQSKVCGGAANEIQCRIFLILMEVRSGPASHLPQSQALLTAKGWS